MMRAMAKRSSRPKLGQHFLMHARIAERIADSARLPEGATVLEVGPGRGILTRALLARSSRVVAVEADRALYEKLKDIFAREIASGHLVLLCDDIRNHISRYSVQEGSYHVVANIPYYLTGELFRMFLSAEHQPRTVTFLVQKEVAERIVGSPERSRGTRSKKESILSLSVKAYGKPKYEFTVPRGAFIPPPKVDSAVLTIRDISRKNFATRAQEEQFFALLHAGFAHKRKFVRSNLADLVTEKALRDAGVPEGARAEDLPLSAWLALYPHALYKSRPAPDILKVLLWGEFSTM